MLSEHALLPRQSLQGVRPATYLLWAAWFGLATGVVELCLLAIAKFLLKRAIHVGVNVVWMAPVADVLILSIPAILFALISWKWSQRSLPKLAAFVFAFLGFLSVLFMYQRLAPYSAALLAAGLATQTCRIIIKHLDAWNKVARSTLAWLTIVIGALGVGLHGWQWVSENNTLRRLPAVSLQAPNVLLIVMDTVRSRNLGLYGYSRDTTPNLDRLAKNGVVFDQSFATTSWTLPSHGSMFTGHYPHQLSTDWAKPLDGTFPTLAEVFHSRGYLTAGFVGNVDVCSYEWGLNRGFTHYEDYGVSLGEIIRSSSLGRVLSTKFWLRKLTGYYQILGRKKTPDVNRDFLGWLSRQESRPFFVFLNYFGAHSPYLPPKPFDKKFDSGVTRSNPWMLLERTWTPEQVQAEVDAYDGAIAHLDSQIGLLIEELEKRNLLKNTLVVITSDHGEEFLEHNLVVHGNSLYDQSVRVPLLMLYPTRVPGGRRVMEPVTLRDIPATIVDLAGLSFDSPFPGNSLSRYWNDAVNGDPAPSPILTELKFAKNLPAWFPVSKGDMKALTDGKWHYILNGDGTEELYDLVADSEEKHNLAGTPGAPHVMERFRRSLRQILTEE